METSGKLGLLMATVIGLAATAAVAQDSNGDQGGAPGHGQMFQQVKARILQNIKDREACVQAANDFEDLLGCKPQRGQGGGQGGGDGGGQNDGGDTGSGGDGN